MSDRPQTRNARSGDVSIAYQVVGDGPLDLVYTAPGVGTIEMYWDLVEARGYFERLASFSRLILFDKRGTGMSDRVQIGTMEERMDDIRAVMDAAGCERAALFGLSEGGPMSMLFTASYPARVSALILYGTFAYNVVRDEEFEKQLGLIDRYWGKGYVMQPAYRHLPEAQAREAAGRLERLAASPGAVRALYEMNAQIDVRSALPAISVPTLVLHKTHDNRVPLSAGRYIAERIPGAVLHELPGEEHVPEFSDWELIIDEVEEFLTGMRPGAVPDRVLATVLFTDIVGSTTRATELGDRAWRQLLDRHDEAARRLVQRFRGTWVKHTGDGILATFDGPARGVMCAKAMGEAARSLGLQIRAGLHTGECEMRGDDVGGIAVHTAQRVSALAGDGEVLVSRTVTDLVAGSGLEFDDRGEHQLKGVPGSWQLYAVRA